MAYEGWFRFGGNEVVNNERARGIASTVECPMFWLKGPRCTTLQDALGDAEYNATNLPDAPWFDPSMPEVSGRFFGVFALSVSGLNDSTRGASVVEGIDDGATIGRTRKSARQVRVRAMLLARGRDALDYGVSWLNAALDPDACGQHGTGCGTTDLEYLTDCPPARGEIPDFTPWVEARRNRFLEPIPATAAMYPVARFDRAFFPDPDGDYVRGTVNATGSSYFNLTTVANRVPVTPGETIQRSASVRLGATATTVAARIYWIDAAGNILSGSVDGSPVGDKDWATVTATGTAPANAAFCGIYLLMSSSNPVGATLDVRDVYAGPDGDYFSGATESTELVRYSWAGAANASESIEEVRSPIVRPRTDEEYAALVEPYRRFLHNVSVTSGPLERELMNKGEFWGQIFEWTYTAGRPWVYSATRGVDLPITPTVVIQDTPFNLVPYPSAELAGGDVDAAYNFSANPSVETNATGWTFGADGVNIAPSAVTGSRVTGELAAVGTASYRVVFTATGAGANGYIYVQQEVDLSARPAGSRVSINFWAAELLMAGVPVRPDIEIVAYWRATSGGATLREDTLGTIPVNGGALSVKSLVPPAGANFVLVRARARLTSWPAGTVVRLYADALAVTVP